MINDIYNARILELAGNIAAVDRLEAPDATATAHSKLCGSTVTVDLALANDRVAAYGHEVKACALGQASAAVVARHIVGTTASELRALRETMIGMLKHDGPPPQGRFADLACLQPVKDYRARHASTLLVFDAVVDALDQIAAREHAA
ncbi:MULTISPECIES: iron-sulfur cluster assembly scaffold protein [unclassified Roseitalea]|uniref:iron-sulfur cluster assembly scaffold protein n=1 Tax=unclassified Roseitalea TaxID=2639107 RepID=UPI00273D7434|nr:MULTISPECIES: iron-sulfur cluster assembly scaffold protein [unclassified Roseitalea]